MRSHALLSAFLFSAFMATGQNPMKNIADQPFIAPDPLHVVHTPVLNDNPQRKAKHLSQNQLQLNARHDAIERFHISASGSMWFQFKQNDLWQSRTSLTEVVELFMPASKNNLPVPLAWTEMNRTTDDAAVDHIRITQTLGGYPIKGQDFILHIERNQIRDANGFAWTGPLPEKLITPQPAENAQATATEYLLQQQVKFQPITTFAGLHNQHDETSLIWIPTNGKLTLAYEIKMHPNALDHWTLYVNAATLEVMQAISQTCSIYPESIQKLQSNFSANSDCSVSDESDNEECVMTLMDGATTTTDQDLAGQNRTVHAYQVGTNFFMIDASRPGMFKANQSIMPNEPVGTIWTVDAQNTSPQQSNFEVVHASNNNNNWKNLEVSAHYNAGQAYEYFLGTYSRNSINGSGGNIISIINVTDENDNNMDNAFWNGSAMFYGNGDVAFNALARALDVAGHEMSHGVIQNTANLEYVGQSGALNESYADVFGAMIDRDDWKMGEDVVKLSAFPSGALRDLSNPNNGGSQLGHPGWQPKHMSEFVSLPNTPEGDNGGVHINSGIPNRAFFILATNIGKNKAEQIYYKALRDYLVKSSQFIDMRLAVEKASIDLHGNNSPELDAVRNAFNTVGIGGGQGGDFEEDIDLNNGSDFILATDANETDLYWVPPTNPSQFVKMNLPAPISRPSFTDDGASCVYVDNEQNMIVVNFDWSSGLDYEAFYLENNPQGIWRNVVVSKDGTKIAYTTANLRNEIFVFDFVSGQEENFLLFNPTTAGGGLNTGDVLYPDAMEWDYTGGYIMYDALNRIESNFGNGIEYWDISFLEAWNNQSDQFASGQIGKLFSALPENISVGNPSFSKNSPYIITFDFLETYFDNFGSEVTDYYVIAANIEAGVANNIYQNTTVGYPSYSKRDDKILFTFDDAGEPLLATINTQSTNKTLPVNGTDVVLITGAQKGVWFVTGQRLFNSTSHADAGLSMQLTPQPATDMLQVTQMPLDGTMKYTIADMSGSIIQTGQMQRTHTINIEGLSPGMYVLQLDLTTGYQFTSKFVKQ